MPGVTVMQCCAQTVQVHTSKQYLSGDQLAGRARLGMQRPVPVSPGGGETRQLPPARTVGSIKMIPLVRHKSSHLYVKSRNSDTALL